MRAEILTGDCRAVMPTLPKVDSIVTDPPYHLASIVKRFGKPGSAPALGDVYARSSKGFMGKEWDGGNIAFDPATWALALDVLKPGGHLLAFGGTRGYHRMICAIEDAGFEIRDCIMWVYGSGFPKSHNQDGQWEGWGTALKPAWEPICVARKPLDGTVAGNLAEHGVGALNIDGCRVETTDNLGGGAYAVDPTERSQMWGEDAGNSWRRGGAGEYLQPTGRWPANLIHDGSDDVLAGFPEAKGQQADVSATAPSDKTSNVYGKMRREGEASADSDNDGTVGFKMKPGARRLDSGSAARFFYCAKASKSDRSADNNHPTVKPTDLMRYLCRLVTPPGGTVLDPFAGSGSTGKAAALEGFNFIGIESDEGYAEIARRRINV